jgi:histidine ammonia-lyase
MLLATVQGLELRRRQGALAVNRLGPEARAFFNALQEELPFIEEDVALDSVLRDLVKGIQDQRWSLYP